MGNRKGTRAGAGTGTGQVQQYSSGRQRRHNTAQHVPRQARPLRLSHLGTSPPFHLLHRPCTRGSAAVVGCDGGDDHLRASASNPYQLQSVVPTCRKGPHPAPHLGATPELGTLLSRR